MSKIGIDPQVCKIDEADYYIKLYEKERQHEAEWQATLAGFKLKGM